MEKAYDTKALVEKLKAKGMDVAEDAAILAVTEVMAWFKESALLSENKYDDLVLGVLPLIETEILKLVDKIDGKEG